jgi:hypothetical protein
MLAGMRVCSIDQLALAAWLIVGSAFAEDHSITVIEIPDEWVDKAIDLDFLNDGSLLVIQPQLNAYHVISRDDEDLYADLVHDCYQGTSDGVPCSDYATGDSERTPYCPMNFCSDCFHKNDVGHVWINLKRHLTNAVAVEALPNGDVIITPSSGQLGFYNTYNLPLLELWTACSGSGEATGDQDHPNAYLVEYGVVFGSDVVPFSLAYTTGDGFVSGRVVGGSNESGKKLSSRRGSGQGGTGPYPGTTSEWELESQTTFQSQGRDTTAGDFDGDGREDLVIVHTQEDALSILPLIGLDDTVNEDGDLIPGGAIFGEPIQPIDTLAAPLLVEAGDFDGDGDQDLFAWSGTNTSWLYRGDGMMGLDFWAVIPTGASSPPADLVAVDLDGDGTDEIVDFQSDSEAGLEAWIKILDPSNGAVSIKSIPGTHGHDALAMAIDGTPGSGVIALLTRSKAADATLHAWATYEPLDPYEVGFGSCGEPGAGGCTRGTNDTPYCDDLECCIDTCIVDPYCCNQTWDFFCQILADEYCGYGHSDSQHPWEVPGKLVHAGVTEIDAGHGHVLVQADGVLVGFGENDFGECDVPGSIPEDAVQFAAGRKFSLAVDGLGQAHAWGRNLEGQCDVPAEIQGMVSIVDAGTRHAAAILHDGTVRCWGYNGQGQCDAPEGLGNVVEVVAANACTIALLSDGTLVGWGLDSLQVLQVPASIQGQTVSFDANDQEGLALLANGSMSVWSGGEVEYVIPAGQLGEVADFHVGSSVLRSDGTILPLHDFPGNETAIPSDCTLMALGGSINYDGFDMRFCIAVGKRSSIKGHLVSVDLGTTGDPDINGDGIIDGRDLALVLSAWGTPSKTADLNNDGIVNGLDLTLLLESWSRSN